MVLCCVGWEIYKGLEHGREEGSGACDSRSPKIDVSFNFNRILPIEHHY